LLSYQFKVYFKELINYKNGELPIVFSFLVAVKTISFILEKKVQF